MAKDYFHFFPWILHVLFESPPPDFYTTPNLSVITPTPTPTLSQLLLSGQKSILVILSKINSLLFDSLIHLRVVYAGVEDGI